ncbi:hypothetical protein EBI00_01565 [Marinomonas hwangdonensis]|uniref:Uncharacterized protein n=1 Tax=Marinomonas hwangdonensis TaxID=1053647 RepID=A0A3M8QAT8_9GAMM|nr:hypothetical protein EBI00_01565 [Marinomonas hwangdonensis]
MEFQGHCLTSDLPPNKQSMPYDTASVGGQSCAYEESQVKDLKANFCFLYRLKFLGASKKLPAQLLPELKSRIKLFAQSVLMAFMYIFNRQITPRTSANLTYKI